MGIFGIRNLMGIAENCVENRAQIWKRDRVEVGGEELESGEGMAVMASWGILWEQKREV